MYKKIKKIRKDENGQIFVPMYIFILVGIIFILYSLQIFNVVIAYQNVNYTAKSIAKVIECDGAVTKRAYQHLDELNKDFNMNMTFAVSDVNYFDSREKTIQFRDSFTITVSDTKEIVLADPTFGKPWTWKFHLVADVTGMSEVYWK